MCVCAMLLAELQVNYSNNDLAFYTVCFCFSIILMSHLSSLYVYVFNDSNIHEKN